MEGWSEHEGELYHINSTASEGQVSAAQYCQDLGGHLVSITSRGTENFLDQRIEEQNITERTGCLWIGLVNITGEWEWANGDKLSYENWLQSGTNYSDTQKCANKLIQGIYRENKPWLNEYCDATGQTCGKICQKTLESLYRYMNTTDTVTDVLLPNSSMVPSSEPDNNISNTVAFAIAFPVLILILVLLGVYLFHFHGKKKKHETSSRKSSVNSEHDFHNEIENGQTKRLNGSKTEGSGYGEEDSFICDENNDTVFQSDMKQIPDESILCKEEELEHQVVRTSHNVKDETVNS